MMLQTLVNTLLLTSFVAPAGGEHSLKVDGVRREFRVHVPPCYDGRSALPVILAFHGMSANAKLLEKLSELNCTADKYGYIVVYPNGTGVGPLRAFKSGASLGKMEKRKPDDVCFVHAILNHLQRTMCIDSQRVYATGLSNGAMMCYRLATEMPDRIAAIAPIGGALGTAACKPAQPVSIMHFHGTCDNVLPFNGPRDTVLFQQSYHSVPSTIQMFVNAAGCSGPMEIEAIDGVADETRVCVQRHVNCENGAEVILVKIVGGGHQWPRHPINLRYLGKATQEIDANEMMVCFFQRHSLAERYAECSGQ